MKRGGERVMVALIFWRPHLDKKGGVGGAEGVVVSKSLFLNLKQNVSNSTHQNWN